jgi:hypothetical protein
MASAGELMGGATATDIEKARQEKVRQTAARLAAVAAPNLWAMGFDKAVEALENRDMTERNLNSAVYAYAQTHGYTEREQLEAQSPCWPMDRIADMSTADSPNVTSGPITTSRDEAGIGKYDLGGSSPTRDQLYTMLDLWDARNAAEPTRIPLPLRYPGEPEPEVPPHLVGAYREERRFSTGVPEVDMEESVNFRADGTPINGEALSYVVSLRRTEFGLEV